MLHSLRTNIKEYHLNGLLLFGVIVAFNLFSTWSIIIGSIIFALTSKPFKFSGDWTFLITIALLLFYVLKAGVWGGEALTKSLFIAFSSIAVYIISESFFNFKRNDYSFLLFISIMAFTMSLSEIVITVKDILDFGLINPGRQLFALVNDDDARNVTQRVVLMSISIGLGGLSFLRPNDISLRKLVILNFVFAIIGVLCSIHFVSRTGILLFFLSLILGYLYVRGVTKRVFLFLFLICLAFFLLKDTEIFQLYLDRETDGSTLMEAGGRTERWKEGWNLIQRYPQGAPVNMWLSFWAHNLWLDFGKVTGMLPFITLVLLSIINVYRVFVILFKSHYSVVIKLTMLLSLMGFLAANCTEPIHQGIPNFFIMYIGFFGVTNGLYKRRNR